MDTTQPPTDDAPFTTAKFAIGNQAFHSNVILINCEMVQQFQYGDDNKVAENTKIVGAAVYAATTLHRSGYDAQKVFEALPEIMEELAALENQRSEESMMIKMDVDEFDAIEAKAKRCEAAEARLAELDRNWDALHAHTPGVVSELRFNEAQARLTAAEAALVAQRQAVRAFTEKFARSNMEHAGKMIDDLKAIIDSLR